MNTIEIFLSNQNIMYFAKMFAISICTFYINYKILNAEKYGKIEWILISIGTLAINCFCVIIKYIVNSTSSIICLTILVALAFSKVKKIKFGYAVLISVLSLSINFILYSIAVSLCFLPFKLINMENKYIILFFIMIVYAVLVKKLFNLKRLKKGITFLKKNQNNEGFEILILNISAILLFSYIILSNSDIDSMKSLFIYIIIFTIIMFITIQKSLQLYYKQKLLIQDLEETKKELENKKEEIKQLEKENLEFSKTSHSIAHKQKSLENKLNELILKNEIASEIDLKERINKISKEIYNKTAEIELTKTEIPEIDDMLKYMQSECSKNDIDFQLQLSGNIHHMINHHIAKEKLEILLADHIKNAIIAINYSDNINKSILVRMGIIDGNYGLYIYDSGIEFEIETLLNLGEKPSTTHKESGGTGMGFMNTFDTLKASKASMTIKEYNKPCKDNFTKLIMIKFDDKNEFKICSYRAEEIKNEDIMKKLKIESI